MRNGFCVEQTLTCLENTDFWIFREESSLIHLHSRNICRGFQVFDQFDNRSVGLRVLKVIIQEVVHFMLYHTAGLVYHVGRGLCCEYCFTSLSAHWGNIATRGSLKPGLCPTSYSAQYQRQHCALHYFEQFGALSMHNHDDKYPPRSESGPGTSGLQASVDMNEP